MKATDAAMRAARTRRLKKLIAEKVDRARSETWDAAFRICAAENPNGSSGAFCRWFDEAWRQSIKGRSL